MLGAGSGSLLSPPFCHWILFAGSILAFFQRDLCLSPRNSEISPSLEGTGLVYLMEAPHTRLLGLDFVVAFSPPVLARVRR